MGKRPAAAWAAATILGLAAFPARAGEARFEVDLLAGGAFPSYLASSATSSLDGYGTAASNALRSEAKTGLSYGAGLRYVSSCGFGVELLYERAKLDLDSTTGYDLTWLSVVGPGSESYRLSGSGSLEVDPLSLDLLYRADVAPWIALMVSAGATYERVDLDDRSKVGLVTYVGDSIETLAADTSRRGTGWRTTWNAGLGLDFRIGKRVSVFVDGRYYGNARLPVSGRHVVPGSYTGLHLGGAVPVDAQAAAAYDEQIGSSATTDIDSKMVRAAIGLRLRF